MMCFDRKTKRDQRQVKLVYVYNLFPNSHISYIFYTLIQRQTKGKQHLSTLHNIHTFFAILISAQKNNNELNCVIIHCSHNQRQIKYYYSLHGVDSICFWKSIIYIQNYGPRDEISTVRRWCTFVDGNFWWIYIDSKFPLNGELAI
jgi:hypothetical protein